MKKVNQKQIHLLYEKISPGPREYKSKSILFYEGQIPLACYLVLEGCIILTKKRKLVCEIGPGHIIGLRCFQSHTPSEYTANIIAGSKVFIIDKSTFFEIENHQMEDVQKIINPAFF